MAAVSAALSRLLLRNLTNHRFGGQHEAGNRRCVLQGRARDLRRVDDARLHQVFVNVGLSVVAEVSVIVLAYLANDDGAFDARIVDDLTNRLSLPRG